MIGKAVFKLTSQSPEEAQKVNSKPMVTLPPRTILGDGRYSAGQELYLLSPGHLHSYST